MTKLQCKQLEQEESTNMAEASDSEDSDADAPRPTARIVEVMEDVQPSKATTPAPSRREEDKVMVATSSSSTLDSFHLNLPETSSMSQRATLQLDTSGQTPSTSVPNVASTPSSAQASTISSAQASASSANLPFPTWQEEIKRGCCHWRQQQ